MYLPNMTQVKNLTRSGRRVTRYNLLTLRYQNFQKLFVSRSPCFLRNHSRKNEAMKTHVSMPLRIIHLSTVFRRKQLSEYLSISEYVRTSVSSFNLLASPRAVRQAGSFKTPLYSSVHNRRIFPSKSVNNGKFTISVEKQL